MDIKGGAFVVTGGASGLGARPRAMIVDEGGNVVIADLSDREGSALAAELGRSARFIRTDVVDEAAARAVVDAAVTVYGGLQGSSTAPGSSSARRSSARKVRTRLRASLALSTSISSDRST
jgi:NAD(P)-dependent dehydrogenase (short-subunit alcohol dehydrogenase family)